MVPNLVKQAREAGVQLFVQDGKLNFTARKGAFPKELREKIAANKQEIVHFLTRVDGAIVGDSSSVRLPRATQRQGVPLSFAQQRLWFVDQLEGGSHQYNIFTALRLEGQLDKQALQWAFDEIIRRHEVLRTVYHSSIGGDGLQDATAPRPLPLYEVNLSTLDKATQDRRIHELARAEAEMPFDLRSDLLLRAGLLEIAAGEHVLLFTMHHIASDGWSISILVQEFAALYTAATEQRPSPLEPLALQYLDYAQWQRSSLQQDELHRQIDYWKNKLDGVPRLHSLPIDKVRPPQQQFAGRRHRQFLDRELLGQLRQLAQANGTSLFVLLQSAFSLLVGRWSNEQDVVIGSPVAGRNHKDVEPLIGCFVNTLALRTDLSAELSFTELLLRSKETVLDAFSHQQVPFEMLVDALKPERSLSHSPLFQLLFVLQNNDSTEATLPGLTISGIPSAESVIRYDLELSCSEGDGLDLTWSYADSLFEAATIERIAGSFAVLLSSIVAAPETNIQQLRIVPDADLHAYDAWNETQAAFPAGLCVHQLFEQQAAQNPDAIAAEYEGQQLTYGVLNAKANQLADYLREWGLGPDSLVGVCMERSFEMVVSVLGIMKAGAAYVPLEPSYPRERIDYILKDAALDVVLVQSSVIERVPLSGVDVVLVDDVLGDDFMEGYATANAAAEVTPENLAYVIYTSGSTGQPKGAMVHHRGVVNYLTNAVTDYFAAHHAGSVMSSPLCFDATVTSLLAPLVCGRKLVLLPEAQEAMLAGLAHHLFESETAWLFKLTPAHLEMLAAMQPVKERPHDAKHVLVIGGEQLTVSTLTKWKEHLLPRATFINEYGPTETVVGCSTYRVETVDDLYLPHCASAVSIGKPIRNTTLFVLNEQRQRVPVGAIGELYIGGAGVAHGYLNRPELTADRFITLDADSSDRLYKTGDVVRYLPDGNLVFLGRSDDQVKIRGFRIELGEIAAQIARQPDVDDSLVIAIDELGEKSLVAYVVSAKEEAVLAETLKQSLARSLPDYMLPSAIVVLKEFPLTTNGKIDRKALPAPNRQAHNAYVAPTTETETMLASLWQEILKLGDAVSITANFFNLGGHSLMATRLLSRVAKELNVAVPLRSLFEHPTLREFAAYVDGLVKVAFIPLVPVARDGRLPASFAQQRLWFIDQLEEGSTQYNMPAALRLKGKLDRAALQASFDTIVARHEVLRTRYVASGESCIQDIRAAEPVQIREIRETRKIEAADLEQALRDEASRPFDLARDLMLRVALVRLNDDDHALLLTLHHIASDGWSFGVLVDELSALYRAFSRGEANPLAPLAIQYADFAQWQRATLQGEGLERQLGYWKRQLAGLPPVHALPLDKPRPAQQTFAGGNVRGQLDAATTARLLAFAEERGTTLFMLLQTAFSLLLSRWSNATDIVVGSPVSGRTHKDVEPLIGFFVNTLVLRTKLDGPMTFDELLQKNKQTILDAFSHQDVSFDALVGELQPERSLSYSPLYQILFALQNNDRLTLDLPGLEAGELGGGNSAIRFDLQLAAREDEGRLTLSWSYADALFEAKSIERMAASYEVLLDAIVSNPATAVDRLPLLTEADHQQLARWNETALPYPADQCVHQLFEAQAAKTPDALAVIAGNDRLTYGQLNEEANRIAHALLARGVQPDTRVGLSFEPGAKMLAALLGVLKAGGAYVPLSPTLPEARLQHMRTDGGVEIVLTGLDAFDAFPSHNPHVEGLTPAHLAYVIYTSGTTGVPKGVMIPHEAAVNFTTAFLTRLGLARGESLRLPTIGKWLLLTSITFDIAFFEWFGCLLAGGTVVVADQHAQTDAAELRRLIESEGLQLIQTTPSRWSQLLDAGWQGQNDLVALCGGEALPLSLQQNLAARVASLWNCYGPTEATVWSLINEVRAADTSVALGTGLANYTHHVLDANQQPAAIGAIGELYIGGPSLARGYMNRPELTHEKFVSPEPGTGRLYRTGDLVRYMADGSLAFLGRTDHQVKIRGYRIELAEIEAQLLRIGGVRETVVVARGEGSDKYLAAYVVGNAADADILRAALAQTLPDYMIPTAFVFLTALPLNTNGKVDRNALPEPERQSRDLYVAPANDTETRIAEIWQQTLKLDDVVSATANFFELGGHSLLATRIAAAMSEAFGKTLPVRAIFEHNTVRTLAAHVDQQQETAQAVIVKADRTQPLPLSFSQQRLWFIDQLAEGSTQYNMPSAFRVRGVLDRAALQSTFDAIVARHEVLRTRYVAKGDGADVDGAIQHIQPPRPLAIGDIDFSSLPEADREIALQRLARKQATHPFDLGRDLMLRVSVVRLAPRDHAVLLTLHHIAADGWSVDVLMGEIAALYTAFSRREPSPLAPLPIQYADYAQWQRTQLQGDGFDRQVSYWKTQLADLPAVHSLPLDKPRPARQRYEAGTVLRTLDSGLVAQLGALSQRHRASLFMLLQSAFALLVGRWSRSNDVVIGSPIAGREQRVLDPLIGFFINTLVLRTRLSEGQSFDDLLAAAKQTALDAFAHQSVPFETLVDELKPERSLSHSALFQLMFSMQHRAPGTLELPGLDVTPLGQELALTKFDLNLTAIEAGSELVLRWHYATSIFERETIERMSAAFELLLRGIVAAPEHPVYALPLVTEVVRSKGEGLDRTNTPCVHVAFEAQAAKTPDAVAATHNDLTLTYAALNEQANRVAHALLAQQLPAGARVGVYVERSPEVLVGFLGVLKAGLTYVPFEPSNTAERLRHIVDNGEIRCVVVDSRLAHLLPAGVVRIVVNEALPFATHNPGVAVAHDDSAYVMYTSGSTGVPKGVEITHGGLLDYCAYASERYYAAELNGSFVVTSHGFDITVPSLYVPLLRGGCVTLATAGEELIALADALHGTARAYLLRMTPMHVSGLLSLLPDGASCTQPHVFVIGGEAFPASLARELQTRFPNARIYNHYGPTETVVGCAIYDVTAAGNNPEIASSRLPIGQAMANHELYVLNEANQLAPIGVPGELCIGGAGVAKGYVKQPELTAAKFIANPYGDGRLYKSGDVVRLLPSGNVEFLGRVDDQVKIRGFRIEPGEIESVLKQTVSDALVVVQGEEEHKALIAYVVGHDVDLGALKARVKKALPDYMVPSGWCVLDAFPLNANGKIDRKALPAVDRQVAVAYVAPNNETEERLAQIWQDVLKLKTPPSITANFFDLGGHSLLATRLASQISIAFKCRVPLQAFFQYQDVRTLADFIDGVQWMNVSASAEADHYEDEGTL
jgi:amino acid adenylation domain-containing protein